MEFLNQYSGLFSLIAALAAIFIPIGIDCKQRAERKKEKQNELDAMNEVSKFPMDSSSKDFYIKMNCLKKGLKK